MAMVVVVVERDIDRLVTNASTVFGQDAATDGKIHETFPSVPTLPPLSTVDIRPSLLPNDGTEGNNLC